MYISQITLRDWKAYMTATFEFPQPGESQNIILIGAPNGYGKTSLYEAIILGLYGKDGLPLIARSLLANTDDSTLNISYKEFLKRALHKGAITAGRTSCSVKLVLMDNDGRRLEIQRIWHFSDTGDYRPQDEEIHIYAGDTRKAIGPGTLPDNERDDWFRNYIATNLLPHTLAQFFMFDGEQLSELADREKSLQVRFGIEGLLGLPLLKLLAKDLRFYAGVRRRETPNIADETIEKIEQERDRLVADFDKNRVRHNEVETVCTGLKRERESLTRELANYGTGTQAQLQEQFGQIAKYEQTIEDEKMRLEELLAKDISLALSGLELRKKVKTMLASETVRERWESGKNQGDSNLERFISSVDTDMQEITPVLTDGQREDVLISARGAWEQLWYPPPENCAEIYLHPYMNELGRTKAIDHLEELDKLGTAAVTELLGSIAANEKEHSRLQTEVAHIEAIAPQVESKQNRILHINGELEQRNQEIGELRREVPALEGQLKVKNMELEKYYNQRNQAAPSARRVAQAHKVAAMVDKIVEQAVPGQVDAIAEAMTKAHHKMAHKKDLIKHIAIDEQCNVKLLNADDADLRDYDLSAGEKQIFTQALISAVSSVSGHGFPMVVDTPLGRLDVDHRKGVLNHLVQPGRQIILLSTNTEVVGEYLQEIAPHVQKKYLIRFERTGDIGQSSVCPGYFGETEEQP